MEKADESECLYELKASVPTGLEVGASEECQEVVGRLTQASRGRITFTIQNLEDLIKVARLRSVDNYWVVVGKLPDFCKEEATVLERLEQLPFAEDLVQWEVPLQAWAYYQRAMLSLNLKDGYKVEEEARGVRPVSFRVTCTRGGRQHVFTSMEAAACLGAGLASKFGWKVQMKCADLEVLLNVSGDHMELALALNRESRFNRNISHFGPTSLRPTIAYALLRMAGVKSGDLVVDPLCGGGTIPIEGSLAWGDSFHLAGDIHDLARNRIQANLHALREKGVSPLVDILQWDVCNLPLRDNSLDVFVTDLPFGKKSGRKCDNRILYPGVLKELGRVCRRGSARAVLLTHDNKTLSRALQASRLWHRVLTRWFNLGGLTAALYLILRNNTPAN